ncbi:esterase-like activity of phytase family protein [Azospirillum doebereinerae]|uniref:esterase-like activity of phytase family protein n=1 Tax=Azospirillum doebereinerae TaxID=92933 RepID=UPI001EE60006|nr:esterase-like activity of phytase family protein [Azospirillum doebereinerae]MCG5243893.1 esterase-like activity of phytase family protein [Azospirillum doebereinerae]
MKTRAKTLSILLLLTLSGGCAVLSGAEPAPPHASAVPLDRGRPEVVSVGGLRFRGALELSGGGIGGLSGLWVAPDGARFVAIGDTGLVATGGLDYDAAGRLSGATDLRTRPLAVEEGFSKRKKRTDAEDLARLPDGGWLVALERDHRILRYPSGENGPEGVPTPIPVPPGVTEDTPPNSGLESLTRLADGRFLTIEEGEDGAAQERRAWVTRSAALPERRGDWLPLTYRTAPRFRPTSVAPLPDGGALVLERRVSLLGGWSSRIVRVAAKELRAGAVADGRELARLEAPLLNDNFEGIATRSDPAGETLVYLVSDDNFSALQRGYLVMFALPDE